MAVKKALPKVQVNGTSNDRDKTLELALAQIEKAFGRGLSCEWETHPQTTL
ncbi:MAG: hypothetical protein CM1200mP39_18500 [Dehalococcoidia bacterium]|nr:MAG: hypothetical protein CM1200mP39_18500 [Dehalococcoidia bacterium]